MIRGNDHFRIAGRRQSATSERSPRPSPPNDGLRPVYTVMVTALKAHVVNGRIVVVTTGLDGDQIHRAHRGPGDHLQRSGLLANARCPNRGPRAEVRGGPAADRA